MPNKFSQFFFLMFSNLPALILVVLILSQISYNTVYLECAFNYGDLVLPSCKGKSPPIISFIYSTMLCLCFKDTSYPLFIVITRRCLLSCNYFNAFILSTQAPALCLSSMCSRASDRRPCRPEGSAEASDPARHHHICGRTSAPAPGNQLRL